MATNQERATPEPLDWTPLAKLAFGYMHTQILATAARLGIFDVLGEGERTAQEVAQDCKTHPQATHRLLRAMAGLGLLTEIRPGTFAATGLGAMLRTDHPASLLSLLRMFVESPMIKAWESLDDSVRTGEIAFDKVVGQDFFSYLKDTPEQSELFNAAMSQATRRVADLLPGHYDFGRFSTVVDVGGGDGTLLAAILSAHPGVRGILYDSEEGLAQAPERLAKASLTDRCALRPGDFFAAAPEGGDAYLLKSVIHDWSDERCEQILGHIRRVIPEDGRLLVVEPVLPPVVDATAGEVTYLSDLNMLVSVGGRERTQQDFEELFAAAGFALTSVSALPGQGTFSIVEGEPA